MKLLTLFLFVALSQVWGTGYSQKIVLEKNNIRLESALKAIEKQTNYLFLYDKMEVPVDQRVTVRIRNESIEETLRQLFKGLPLSYKIFNHNIVIRREHTGGAKGTSPEVKAETFIMEEDMLQTVSGRVTDGKGEGLPGVSILIKGTQRGMASDAAGNFSIEVPDQNAVLVFSFVGYVTREITVGNRTRLDVSLEVDEKGLEEVVVVGFGERRLRDLTGSISTVNADRISKIGAVSPQFALQGNAAGVRVINTSGNPNEAPQIFIRGIGTWNGDSQPLYVIDGQILEPPRAGNEDLIGGAGLRTPPNLFNLINANDIESISVLKDA